MSVDVCAGIASVQGLANGVKRMTLDSKCGFKEVGDEATVNERQSLPWMIMQAKAPFHISQVSSGWSQLSGYAPEEVIGRSFKFLQGPATDQLAISRMLEKVTKGQECSISVMTYQKGCRPLITCIEAKPLFEVGGRVERFLAKISCSETLDPKDIDVGKGDWIVLSADNKHGIVNVGKDICALMEFEEASLIGRSIRVLLGPSSNGGALFDEVSACVAGKGSLVAKFTTIYSSSGKPIVFEFKVQAVKDVREGTISQVKIQLSRAEMRTLREVVENVVDCPRLVMQAKPPHVITHVNQPWTAVSGFSEEETKTKSIQMFQSKCTDAGMLSDALSRCGLFPGSQQVRLCACAKSGSPMESMVTFSPLISHSGAVEHFLAEVKVVNEGLESKVEASGTENASLPEGVITHLNGCGHLVIFPREDPTLQHCTTYMTQLQESGIVQSWSWREDALHVDLDTNRVLERTDNSPWCQQWAADLGSWQAWWNRMLWIISETSTSPHHLNEISRDEISASDLCFLSADSDLGFLCNPLPDGGSTDWNAPIRLSSVSEFEIMTDEDMEDECSCSLAFLRAQSNEERIMPAISRWYDRMPWSDISYDLHQLLCANGVETPVLILDVRGVIVFVNELWMETLKCEDRDVLEYHWSVFATNESVEAVALVEQALKERKPCTVKVVSGRRDGTLFSARTQVYPTSALGVPCFAMTLIDCGDPTATTEHMNDMDEFAALQEEAFRQCEEEELCEMQERNLSKIEHSLQQISLQRTPNFRLTSDGYAVDTLLDEVTMLKSKVEHMQHHHASAMLNVTTYNQKLEGDLADLRRQFERSSTSTEQREILMDGRSVQAERLSAAPMASSVEHPEQVETVSAHRDSTDVVKSAVERQSEPAQNDRLRMDIDELSARHEAQARRTATLEGKVSELDEEVQELRFQLDEMLLHTDAQMLVDDDGTADASPDDDLFLPVSDLIDTFDGIMSKAGVDSGLSLLDHTGAILWANPRFLETVGFTREEVVGCCWTSFMCGPETDAEDLSRLEASRANGTADSVCLQCYHERGHMMWLQMYQMPTQLRIPTHGDEAMECPLILLSAIDTTALFRQVIQLGRPMEEARDPLLFRESQRLSALQARVLSAGASAVDAVARGLAGQASAHSETEAKAAAAAAAAAAVAAAAATVSGSAPPATVPCAGGDAPPLPAAVLSAREPWIILEVSTGWEQLFGFNGHDAWGRSVASVLTPQSWSAFAAAAAAAASGGKPAPVAIVGQRRGGELVAGEMMLAPIAASKNAHGGDKAPATQLTALWRALPSSSAVPGPAER